MKNPGDSDIDSVSSEEREILAYLMEQERQARLKLQQILPRPAGASPPLSFAQQRLWILDQMADTGAAYNWSIALQISGPLRPDLLEKCLTEILRRHEVLRSTIEVGQDEPFQLVHPPTPANIEVLDLTNLTAGRVENEIRGLIKEAATAEFDLSRGPLLRARLLRVEDQRHVLVLCMHHIVSDGWSLGVLMNEFSTLYQAYLQGKASPLPELPVQYADYAVWQRNWLAGDELNRQLGYWREKLADLATLELPTDRTRPAVPAFNGDYKTLALEGEIRQSLKNLAQQEGITLFILTLAAFALLLHRYSAQDDIVLGSPIANRNRMEIEGLIGFFVNMLVLRTDTSGNPSFRELLARVRDAAFEAFEHQDLPFERLVDELKVVRDVSRNPLFQVTFALEEKQTGAQQIAEGLTLAPLPVGNPAVRFDLEFFLTERQQDLLVLAVYNTDLFDAATIERMLGHYQTILTQIAVDPAVRIDDLELLTGAERKRQIVDWNQTHAEYPEDKTVCELFENQAATNPQALAVSHEGEALSYAELNTAANRLAHYLIDRGVATDVSVVVLLQRRPELIVAQLAILKAGGAYVPTDPDYPRQRLSFILQDTRAPLLLTESGLLEKVSGYGGECLCLDSGIEELKRQSEQNPGVATRSQDLAYVIYTSGSTGEPKGVEIAHRGLTNLVSWHCRTYQVTSADRATHLAGLGFDATVWELWPYLCAGASVHLVPDEQRLEPGSLLAWMAERGITLSFLPTPLAESALQEPLPADLGLRALLTGGDRLHGGLLDKELPFDIVNHYGPSENSVVSTWCKVDSMEPEDPPIGKPIDNVQTYILDRHLQPVPIGVAGELYLGGDGLARGYLNQAELTAQKFIVDPFAKGGEGRLYRSGDVARYRPDGAIEFIGRADNQVKLRGFRIELGEIESVLNTHPGIAGSVVALREDESGVKRLVAYLVSEGNAAPTMAEIRNLVRERLPEYMLPAAIVNLDRLPLTANGKVDRRGLPDPEDIGTGQADSFTPPRTELEQQLGQIWTDVLRLERVGVEDNFFELGGHSLMATQVVSRIRKKLDIELPLSHLFAQPTVARLAPVIEALRSEDGDAALQTIAPADRTGLLPLSFPQQRLWYLDQLEPGSSAYIIPGAIKLRGSLDIEALRRSLQEIVNRHEVLRTTFSLQDGQAAQNIVDEFSLELPVEDLREISATQRSAMLAQRMNEEALKPFDLERGPVMRARLLSLDGDEHVLIFAMHHIVSDGWSFGVFFREMGALYAALCRGQSNSLPELPLQYADFAAWQRQWLSGDVLRAQLDYWIETLDGISTLQLPTDRPRPPIQTFSGAHATLQLDSDLTRQLQEVNSRYGVTPFMTLVSAFAILLQRYCSQDDIVIGTPIANRNHREVEDLIGFFVNTLVVRTDVSGNPGFDELLHRVKQAAIGAFQHQDLPFETLVDELQPERDRSRNPLFQVLLALQNTPSHSLVLEGLTLESMSFEAEATRFDLELHIWQGSENLRLDIAYNTDLFNGATIERMLGHYRTILTQIAVNPAVHIDDLELLTGAERKRQIVDWNQTHGEYPEDKTVCELFENQVAANPDAIALEYADLQLSYAELNARANQLAHYLRARGVGAEVRVGLYLERDAEMVVAVLGILKAGGAYLPLDLDYPASRISFMLDDAGVPVLLSQSDLIDRLPAFAGEMVCLQRDWTDIGQQSVDNPAPVTNAQSLAYVIYTSGSTGTPKGVEIQHRAINRLVRNTDYYQVEPTDRIAQASTFSFDAATFELWGALLNGARLVGIDKQTFLNSRSLASCLQERAISAMFVTTAVFNQVARELPSAFSGLKCLLFGGEAVDTDAVREVLSNRPPERLLHVYGPTESTTFASWYQIDSVPAEATTVPIGRPLANTTLYVLDTHRQPVPVGVPGELYIGGDGLARGYLNRAELSAERFVPHPFIAGERLYRTGDKVRYRADAAIEFIGRFDHQVKLRGFRIELGEIEAELNRQAGIDSALVLLREDRPGDKRLVAYLVGAEGGVPPLAELRAQLRERLPDYMLPSALVTLERLPLNANGKVDREALPRPQAQKRTVVSSSRPETEMEIILAEIWQELLEIDDIETDDMFFDLGGHSLLTIKVIDRFFQETGVRIPVASFMTQTLRQLAAFAETSAKASGQDSD